SVDSQIPTARDGGSLEHYDDYYRSRFDDRHRDRQAKIVSERRDGRPKRSRLWNNIESLAQHLLHSLIGTRFRLGRHALLIDSIRYKSTEGWLGDGVQESRLLSHEAAYTRDLLDAAAFRV